MTCGDTLVYDGLEDGLLNMGKFIISHQILRRFMHLLHNGGYEPAFMIVDGHTFGTHILTVLHRLCWHSNVKNPISWLPKYMILEMHILVIRLQLFS